MDTHSEESALAQNHLHAQHTARGKARAGRGVEGTGRALAQATDAASRVWSSCCAGKSTGSQCQTMHSKRRQIGTKSRNNPTTEENYSYR